MNTVNQIGRLTRDPELSYTKSNKEIAKFSIAVNNAFKKDEVYFFNCVAWGKQAAAICQYLKKGSQVGISGSLQQDRWQDENQKNRSSVSININSFTFCGGKNESEDNNSAVNNGNNQDWDTQKGERQHGKPDISFEDVSDQNDNTDEVPFS